MQRENEDHDIYHDPVRGLMHRCKQCAKELWYITGKPAVDNGFIDAAKPIVHVRSCRWHSKTIPPLAK